MGYQTRYRLEYTGQEAAKESCPHCGGTGALIIADPVERALKEPGEASKHPIDDNFGEEVKWYDHEEDMKAFSRKFPAVLFTLNGEGEESGDVWVKYFKNGKMQASKAEIKLAAFDPAKLG